MLAWVPHRVEGHDAAFQRQGRQQLGNGCLLIRFLRRRPPPGDQAGTGGEALTRCSGVASTLPVRRLVLPSMATTVSAPSAGRTVPTQRRNAASNSLGSIQAEQPAKGVMTECQLPA